MRWATSIDLLLGAVLALPPFFVLGWLTILLVEQRVVEALELCDRGYVLETGRVVLAGPRDALLADTRVPRAYLRA
jgi:ABC-type branched-subunit amino acid transport system ATPase component